STRAELSKSTAASGNPPTSGPATAEDATALARQSLAALTQIDLSHGPLTDAQANAWKQNLQQLEKQGAPAIPAIREFLQKNLDIVFDNDADRRASGYYPSLRLALLDVLQKIGGPEAEAAFLEALQSTADPLEIATLSRYLDRAAPGKYAEAASSAAREALSI